MIPAWVAPFVGIPWRDGGRDRDGCDCYGLIALVLRDQFDIEVPSYIGRYTSARERDEVAALLVAGIPETGWVPVVPPLRAGDGVVFRLENQPWHVGIMVDRESFLHVLEGAGASAIERLAGYRWARRLVGVYRHRELLERA